MNSSLLTELRKKYGTVIPEGEHHHAPPTYLSTGIGPLDRELGGGLPRGFISLIYGPDGAGKTGMMGDIMLEAAKNPVINGHTLYLALESKVNTELFYMLGVKDEDITVIRTYDKDVPLTGGKALDIINSSIGEVELIIVDSVPYLVPSIGYEAKAEDNVYALVARLLSRQLPLIASRLGATKTVIILINQERANHGFGFVKYKMYGAKALRHDTANRIRVKKSGFIPKSGDPKIGFSITADIEKNSLGTERGHPTWDVYYGVGADKVKAAYDTAKDIGLITKRSNLTLADGSLLDLNHKGNCDMRDAIARLKEEPDLLAKVVEAMNRV